jgi:hypothetical protein
LHPYFFAWFKKGNSHFLEENAPKGTSFQKAAAEDYVAKVCSLAVTINNLNRPLLQS